MHFLILNYHLVKMLGKEEECKVRQWILSCGFSIFVSLHENRESSIDFCSIFSLYAYFVYEFCFWFIYWKIRNVCSTIIDREMTNVRGDSSMIN
jgi:hypothetical protein